MAEMPDAVKKVPRIAPKFCRPKISMSTPGIKAMRTP